MKKPYNTTQLNPWESIERGIMHRDINAHIFRWTHILKEAKIGDSIVDFGCGSAELLETIYRNKFKPSSYTGLDIRQKTVQKAAEKYKNLKFPAYFITADLVKPSENFSKLQADKVVSFEVIEHVGKKNAKQFLKNFKDCGGENATYYLSTPNYDPSVGAAGNHTYDSGDGKGVQPQEFDYLELHDLIEDAGLEIVKVFGTFASQKDYVEFLTNSQREVYEQLKEYYDSNLVSNIMAPIIDPVNARNCMWVLRRAK